MMRKKINDLLNAVSKEVEKAQEFAQKTKDSADEIAKTSATSWSAAGDREHSRGQAIITEENLKRLSSIKDEVKQAVDIAQPESVTPICFVEIQYNDMRKDSFYLVNMPMRVSGMKLVSASSPLGLVLLGKKINDSFQFDNGEQTIIGKVLSIE